MGKEEIKYLTLFLLATMGEMEAAVCMTDHFDKIQKLPDPIPGCPNFRRVPGFKVYCSGQPTIEGFGKALEKVCGTIYPKDGPIIWFNLRQEPTVYVNGNPICARPANKIGVNAALLKTDNYTMDPTKDALFRGEFEVVKDLVSKLADGQGAKNNADKIIDLNGTKKTGGTGIKQLRENIAESKLSYEIMDDAAQAFLKSKIMDNIHKYFYIIVFTAYMREMAEVARTTMTDEQKAALTLPGGKTAIPGNQLKLPKTFVAFMEEHSDLRGLIDSGKGDL